MRKHVLSVIAVVGTMAGLITQARADAVLFQDTFDREDNTDISANIPTGQSGALVGSGVAWRDRGSSAASGIAGNRLYAGKVTDNAMSSVQPDLNFTTAPWFEVSMEVDFSTIDADKQFAFGVGADASIPPWGHLEGSALGVGMYADGRLFVSNNGVMTYDNNSALPNKWDADPFEVKMTFETTDFNEDTLVTMTSFMYAGQTIDLHVAPMGGDLDFVDQFVWLADNQNYIWFGQHNNTAPNTDGTQIDDFTVTKIPEPTTMLLFVLGGMAVLKVR